MDFAIAATRSCKRTVAEVTGEWATLGVVFEGNPELVTSPEHALKPALQEWTDNNLNSFADRNDLRTITRKINRGFNGLA